MKKIQKLKTEQGFHGDAWAGIYGFTTFRSQGFAENMIASLEEMMKTLEGRGLPGSYTEKSFPAGPNINVAIFDKKGLVTFFPKLPVFSVIDFKATQVHEWTHIENVSAFVQGGALGKFPLSFFATDYLEQSDRYLSGESLQINLSALIYKMDNLSEKQKMFSDEFNGFGSVDNNTNDMSVSGYRGRVEAVAPVPGGHYVTLNFGAGPIKEMGGPDFIIDGFVAEENCTVTDLTVGVTVTGMLRFIGEINTGLKKVSINHMAEAVNQYNVVKETNKWWHSKFWFIVPLFIGLFLAYYF